MSKLSTALVGLGLLGAVGAGYIALDGTGTTESPAKPQSVTSNTARPALLPGACQPTLSEPREQCHVWRCEYSEVIKPRLKSDRLEPGAACDWHRQSVPRGCTTTDAEGRVLCQAKNERWENGACPDVSQDWLDWRVAVAARDERSTQCSGGMTDTTAGCMCITGDAELPGEIADRPQDHPRLWVCPADGDAHQSPWTLWTADGRTPAPGCRLAIPPGRFGGVSMTGVDLGHARHLSALCGWPGSDITGGRWGSCPHCLMWPEGCGPCRAIADKYGRGWPGHEAECIPDGGG